MEWNDISDRLPKSLMRVWVETNTGRKTTAYLKSDGDWFLFCRKIAETGAKVVRWRE